jgi:hypothetical protein
MPPGGVMLLSELMARSEASTAVWKEVEKGWGGVGWCRGRFDDGGGGGTRAQDSKMPHALACVRVRRRWRLCAAGRGGVPLALTRGHAYKGACSPELIEAWEELDVQHCAVRLKQNLNFLHLFRKGTLV